MSITATRGPPRSRLLDQRLPVTPDVILRIVLRDDVDTVDVGVHGQRESDRFDRAAIDTLDRNDGEWGLKVACVERLGRHELRQRTPMHALRVHEERVARRDDDERQPRALDELRRDNQGERRAGRDRTRGVAEHRQTPSFALPMADHAGL